MHEQSRAVVADRLGKPADFVLRYFDPGGPGPGQMRIRVKAAGLSFVDVLTAAGKYQIRPEPPFVPGSEIAGVVEIVGQGGDAGMIGRRVLASSPRGALAEAVNVAADRVWPMPEAMDFVTAAAFRVGFLTAYEGIVRLARAKAGESIVVLGASGTVGLAAVQLGHALGLRVIASCSTAEKRTLAARHGATDTIDSTGADWRTMLERANGGRPVDIVFDPVGGAGTEPAYRALGWGGRHLMVGFASGSIASVPTNLSIIKGTSLIGVNVGRLLVESPQTYEANLMALYALYEEQGVAPVIASLHPLDDFVAAMEVAGSGAALGRVVVTMGD